MQVIFFPFQSLWPNSSSTKSRSILIGWIGRWYYNSNFLHIQLLPCVPFCSIEIYQQKTSQKLIWDGGDLILPNFWRFITYQDHFPSLLCTITCLILHHIYCSITSKEYDVQIYSTLDWIWSKGSEMCLVIKAQFTGESTTTLLHLFLAHLE